MSYCAWEPIESGVAGELCSGLDGAVVSFVGVVRRDRHGARTVDAIEYDAYIEMAERQIGQLVAQARARWPLGGVRIRHRIGTVPAGQISVVVAVTAGHRAEAYAASRMLIEGIKQQVPIWKREVYDDGTSRWGGCAAVAAGDHAHV